MPKSFDLVVNCNSAAFCAVRRLFTVLIICSLLVPALAMPEQARAEISADPDAEIVYIDIGGTIRVLDTLQTGGNPIVDWASPTAGWSNFALGDVNNDGDQEIVAIKGGGGTGTLAVFDPVVSSGSFDGKSPNGIPWAKLYETTVPGDPKLVATGKFDPNLPGAHIFYTYDLNGGSQAVVLKPAVPNPDGRQWAVHYTRSFDERWEQVSIGNLDNEGADEIALVDDSVGRLSVFRSDATSEELLKKTGDSRPWRATTFAQYDAGSTTEVIGIRDAPPSLSSFFVFKYNKDKEEFEEKDTESFSPSPRFAFPADINDDGKDAIVMLRNVSEANSVRMIVRGDDGDEIPSELEQFLDSDNGYQVGAGGDVDGDGKDEIVIMRDNNIRVYTQPDRNASRSDYALQTNSYAIHIGDLDKNGFTIGPRFSTSISSIEETLQIGTTGNTNNFEIRNETTNVPISYQIGVENNPSWLSVTPRFGNTPGVISYTANAIGLEPGTYTTRIVLTSDNQTVVNQPYYISVKLTVTPATFETNPSSLGFNFLSTSAPTTRTQTINLFGAAGVRFSVGIAPFPTVQAAAVAEPGKVISGYTDDAGNVVVTGKNGQEVVLIDAQAEAIPWLSVTPERGTVSAILTVSMYPSKMVEDVGRAYIVIIGDERTGTPPDNVRLVPVTALRANHQLYVPWIDR
ncbi:MAG TPA: hypothetical protein P5121_30130 [Caldilineaceae bacterium]|nr:hypothetical protein [Caldilineaceae bacterium]HRW09412.1 hypothetical protein [Caldilineaceae bacterium]